MNTTAGPVGSAALPSNNRWWAIAASIGLAAVLGYGAALVATDHLPGATHTAAAPVAAVATPQVESIAGSDDLATRSATGSSGVITQSALDPSVTGFEYGQEATTGHVVSPGVTGQYFGNSGELYSEAAAGSLMGITVDPNAVWGTGFSDPSELYPAVVGSSGAVIHSALDPFEERSGAVSSAVGTSGAVAQSYAGVDDLATRSSAVGASGIVEQSILDALEERSGAVSSAVGTSGAVAQSYAGPDDLATRLMASEAIRYAGVDEFVTQFMASEAIRYAAASDLATRSTVGASGIVE